MTLPLASSILATAFLDLLPEAAHEGEATETNVFFWALGGILLYEELLALATEDFPYPSSVRFIMYLPFSSFIFCFER